MRPQTTTKIAARVKPRGGWPVVFVALASSAFGAGGMWFFNSREVIAPKVSAPSEAAEMPPNAAGLPPAQAAMLLGNWHYDRKRWTQAIEQYEAAIRLGFDNADVRTDLGNCFRFLGQPQKALEQYQAAQRQNPRHENSLFNTAGIYGEVLHDPNKAADTWREYLRRFPDGAGAARARQSLAESEQHTAEQAAMLKRLISDDVPKERP